MPESKNRGFSSAAGLIQYYDMEETKAVKIPPFIIIGLGIGVSILVDILSWRLG
jgi:preprotein translocase subunit Sec61beta